MSGIIYGPCPGCGVQFSAAADLPPRFVLTCGFCSTSFAVDELNP